MKNPLCVCVTYRKDFPMTSCIYGFFRQKILFRTAQITKLDSGISTKLNGINLLENVLDRQK